MKLFQWFRKAAAVKCVSDVLELLLYNSKNRMFCRNTSWKNQTPVLQWLDKLSLNRIVKRRAEQFRLENDSVFHGDFF